MLAAIDALASLLQTVVLCVKKIGVHCGDNICCLGSGQGYKFPAA